MVRYRKRVCIVNRVESRCMIMDHLTVEVSKLQYHDMSECVCWLVFHCARRRPQYPGVLHSTLYYMYKPAHGRYYIINCVILENRAEHAANVEAIGLSSTLAVCKCNRVGVRPSAYGQLSGLFYMYQNMCPVRG